MRHVGTSVAHPAACAVALAACASTSACYLGFAGGPAYATGRAQAKSGANSSLDLGLAYDYRRIVRVMYARSLQLYGGAQLGVDGEHVVVPLENEVEVQVTTYRFAEETYLRALARGFWGSEVRVGQEGHELVQSHAHAYAGMLGASLLFAGDHEQLGPTDIVLSLGLLAGRAETRSLGEVSFLAPMATVGFDFFPPLLIYCVFIDDKCPHHLDLGAKN